MTANDLSQIDLQEQMFGFGCRLGRVFDLAYSGALADHAPDLDHRLADVVRDDLGDAHHLAAEHEWLRASIEAEDSDDALEFFIDGIRWHYRRAPERTVLLAEFQYQMVEYTRTDEEFPDGASKASWGRYRRVWLIGSSTTEIVRAGVELAMAHHREAWERCKASQAGGV